MVSAVTLDVVMVNVVALIQHLFPIHFLAFLLEIISKPDMSKGHFINKNFL